MDQDDQFHSFWGESSQLLDLGMPYLIQDIPKFPFDEPVQSPIVQDYTEGFQLSPTLIPINPEPISTSALPTTEHDFYDKGAENFSTLRKCQSAQPTFGNSFGQINASSLYPNNPQIDINNNYCQMMNSAKNTKNIPVMQNDAHSDIQSNQNAIPLNQTKEFFENLFKVLDKQFTKEQMQLISNSNPNFMQSFQPKKPLMNVNQPKIAEPNNLRMNEEIDFNSYCPESEFVVNPQKLGFIPSNSWMDKEMSFGYLVNSFFQKRNNASSRFSHKLFNALKLSTAYPNLTPYIGVEWITPTILKVNKFTFARLLKIKTIDGSLFHQQGNFPSHGFVELTEREAHECLTPEQLQDVDYESIRLLKHPAGIFTKHCTGSDIADCKWINSRRRHQ